MNTSRKQRSLSPTAAIAPLALAITASLLFAVISSAQVTKVDELSFGSLPDVTIPVPERFELSNGLVVFVLEDHELPLVEATAVIRTGARLEPAAKSGLAGLTGQVLRDGGTEAHSSDELDDLLEDHAARIESSIGLSSGSVTMSSLSDDLPKILSIFADVLRRPAFDEDKLEVARTQLVAAISRQNDDASQILDREFSQLIYGEDSAVARDQTYESVGSITRDDLVAWHRAFFHPDRIILGFVGDFETDDIKTLVEENFGDWQRGPAFEMPAIETPAPRPGYHFVEKSDVTQSYIAIGHLGITRNHPDYFAVEVMNQVLGGSFAARLFNNVRSKKGLAYNVRGGVGSNYDYPGVFRMRMSTKTETTAAGIDALLEEAANMTALPPSAEEVEKAKGSILNSFVFRADSTSKILRQQLTYEYYGFPLDWQEQYRTGIEQTTLEEVRQAAADFIHPDQFTVLVVGNTEGVDRPLESFGDVQMVDITIPEPAAEEVEKTAEGIAQAAEILDRAVAAVGGAEALAKVESTVIAGNAAMATPQGEMTLGGRFSTLYPDRMRQELNGPMGAMVRVLNDQEAFMQMGPQTQPLPDSQRAGLREEYLRNLVTLLKMRDSLTAVAAGEEEHDGATLDIVHIEIEGIATRLGIDRESGEIRTQRFRGTNMMGSPGELLQIFSDYRKVEPLGLMLPFSAHTTFDGSPMMSVTVSSIEVNSDLDPALFELPTN